ncbi:hypothetical protein [Streptomyces clavuligerus]|nr:hypothetical protein [Streptomyces clavuligerus]ANW22326.1 hypothetical protein BB341_28770 [Streptomyces clavuligerus]AXU17223.1 hypothetical protein D1794_31855 [Streptomyces clavuligerus]EDY47441.1 hypothetical protein SSCG_00469 [Streptomyces clavuligerus]MBY6307131.1 hypothetical protein [Streptomyces clavuligerus]QCS10291.1 hypothetical protein CRV15_32550 [Streptomyces clavuligerus]
MRVRHALMGLGLGAALSAGLMTGTAQAAPSAPAQAKAQAVSVQAPAQASDVVILSCPSGAPAADPGYRCLSPYQTMSQCLAGVQLHVDATPATRGYCRSYATRGIWGYVNIY